MDSRRKEIFHIDSLLNDIVCICFFFNSNKITLRMSEILAEAHIRNSYTTQSTKPTNKQQLRAEERNQI